MPRHHPHAPAGVRSTTKRFLLVFITVACSVMVGVHSYAQVATLRDTYRRHIESPKSKGERVVTIRVTAPISGSAMLDEQMQADAIVILRLRQTTAAQSVRDDYIYDWHTFDVEELLKESQDNAQ